MILGGQWYNGTLQVPIDKQVYNKLFEKINSSPDNLNMINQVPLNPRRFN